jgi:hypothetical protein
MDGKRAEGTTKIYALINSLREEGLVLTLEAVYSHGQVKIIYAYTHTHTDRHLYTCIHACMHTYIHMS